MGESFPFWLLTSLFGVCCVTLVGIGVRENLWRRRYGGVRTGLLWEEQIKKIYRCFCQLPYGEKVTKEIGVCLSRFNAKRYQENTYYASLALLLAFAFLLVLFGVTLFLLWPLWYYAVFYCLLGVGCLLLAFLALSSFAGSAFLKHMPQTVKILSARYTGHGSMAKALGSSLPDFHRSIRPEMLRIYDVIKQNDMQLIRDTFTIMEEKYRNEHMTLLLELIWFAHYRGGDQFVRIQFEEMAQDIVEDLENKRDLRAAVMGYGVLTLLFLGALPLSRLFNESVLGKEGMVYYQEGSGLLVGSLYLICSLLLLFLLLYLERVE